MKNGLMDSFNVTSYSEVRKFRDFIHFSSVQLLRRVGLFANP